jgi:hypothetical protein
MSQNQIKEGQWTGLVFIMAIIEVSQMFSGITGAFTMASFAKFIMVE